MWSFKRASINGKLTLLVLMAAGVAICLSCIAFVIYDVTLIRSSMVKQVRTLADVVGADSAPALNFDEPGAAHELLLSLNKQPIIESACIYNLRGEIFARFYRSRPNRGGEEAPPIPSTPLPVGTKFTGNGYLDVVEPIVHEGERIGTIYLHATMDEFRHQLSGYLTIVAVVMAVSLGASLAISSRLQRFISLPIVNLAAAAERISTEHDHSIRVSKYADDELGSLYDRFNAMLDQIQLGERALRQAHNELEAKVDERTHQLSQTNAELNRQVAERVRTEKELEAAHQHLMDAARHAGMAEIATGVLHNVGNVLNSVNVSATLAAEALRRSKIDQLARVNELIDRHAQDLAAFFTQDPKGKQLPQFLKILGTHLEEERQDVLKELEALTVKVDHIKTIVATQQSYAGVSGVVETFDITTAIDDAIRLNSTSFDRHKITVVREYADLPKVRLDKQKLLQILINLLKNGRDAVLEGRQQDRCLIFRTRLKGANRLQIEVTDNGVGIPKQNVTRIFAHGFTTKKSGHGFGLHSCANAAKEMGGLLTATSPGQGEGATFTIELPFTPERVAV